MQPITSEKHKDYCRKYWGQNKEKLRESRKRYYQANKSRIRDWKKQYRSANKEKLYAINKEWQKKNKFRVALYAYGISGQEAVQFVERTKSGCSYCHSFESLQVDHKIPKILGGSHDIANLQWLCAECNRMKGGRTDEQFLDYISRILRNQKS